MNAWIEAIRPRTLPVSIAGVVAAEGYCLIYDCFEILPAILCLTFAVLAQIVSNFANEYYDYKDGLDRPGREGPRRGVTEGDISPRAMKIATYATLLIACLVGLSLCLWGGWWLIGVGICIAIGALAYSTGPYPLSRHALGEVAVVFFFGIIPVNFTFYLQSGSFSPLVLAGSAAVGLMGANILLVNNYRDMEDDRDVGKITLAVKFGRGFSANLYLFNGFIAVALMLQTWAAMSPVWWIIPAVYLIMHTFVWVKICSLRGADLNKYLGITAMLMLLYALGFSISCACL